MVLVKRIIYSDKIYSHHQRLLAGGISLSDDFGARIWINLFLLSLGNSLRLYFWRMTGQWMVIPVGISFYQSPSLCNSNDLPSRLVFLFQEQERLEGRVHLNSSRFIKPEGLVSCDLTIDGKSVQSDIPQNAVKFGEGLENSFYIRFFENSRTYYHNDPINLTMDKFLEDSFCLCYDLRAAQNNG